MQIEAGEFYKTRNGKKAGPMSVLDDGTAYSEQFGSVWADSGRVSAALRDYPQDLVAKWVAEPAGPVREVTRKEIVSGEFGGVRVLTLDHSSDKRVGVRLTGNRLDSANIVALSAPQLRAASAVLTQLADALDGTP